MKKLLYYNKQNQVYYWIVNYYEILIKNSVNWEKDKLRIWD